MRFGASDDDTTRILKELAAGDRAAEDRLYPRVYDELRGLAVRLFHRQPADHTLQPTALVHEAYLRLVDQKHAAFTDRAHFFAVAAKIMRRLLIDHARQRLAEKRGGDRTREALDEIATPKREYTPDLLDLDGALHKLARLSERQGRVVEMKYFGGMTIAEIGDVLGVSHATVESDWAFARSWLARELTGIAAT